MVSLDEEVPLPTSNAPIRWSDHMGVRGMRASILSSAYLAGSLNYVSDIVQRIELTIPVQPPCRTLVYLPRDVLADRPIAVHLHGGGWTLSLPELEEALCTKIATTLQCIVLAPDYAKAPEYPYPAALRQIHQLLKHVTSADGLQAALSQHPLAAAKEANYNSRRLLLSGSSAGGNLAVALALLLQVVPVAPPIEVAAIGLQYSGLNLETPYETKRTRVMTPEHIMPPPWASRMFLRCYLPDNDLPARSLKYVSPGLASDDELRKLPPIQFVTAENDHYRHENEELYHRLQDLGIPAKLDVLAGVAHAYDVTPTRNITIRSARAQATLTSHGLIANHFLTCADNIDSR